MSPLLGRPRLTGRDLVLRGTLLAVAVLLASAPLSGLLAGSSWLLLTSSGALPVIASGIVLRQLITRTPLVPLLQLVVIALVLLVVQVTQGLVSLGDGPLAILRAQAEIFPAAVTELASGLAPMIVGGRGTVVVLLLIALITLALDLMFIDLGWHTPTGLLLASFLLVPALQQPTGGPWWTVVGPVLAGALIWSARTVHADPSYIEGDSRPPAGTPPARGRTGALVAVACLLVASLAAPLGQMLPQVAPPRVALNLDLLNEWQNRDVPQLGPVMIDDDVSVRRSLLDQQDTEVLRYTTNDPQRSYLRLRTLTVFDGEAYLSAESAGEDATHNLSSAAFSDARIDGLAISGTADELIEHDVEISSLGGNRLPVPENLRELTTDSAEVDEQIRPLATNGELSLGRVGANITGLNYQMLSEENPATPDDLRSVDPAVFAEPFELGYTQREDVPEVTTDLAAQIADDAGADNAFDTAVAFQNFFRNSFAYSLTVRTPPGQDPLESFLDDRIGYCEQFAAAFALMMTAQGYPSRVAIGFTAGQMDGDEWSVTARNAHAWPEVWFGPQHGWVTFEPTPAAAANGVRQPEVTDETPGGAAAEEPAPEDEATEDGADEETTEDDSTEEDTESTTTEDDESTGPDLLDKEGEPTPGLQSSVVALLSAAAGIAAVALVVVALIRRRRVRAREERWAALVAGVAPGGPDGQDGPDGRDGQGEPNTPDGPSLPDGLAAELIRRRAGELAWKEINGELTVRRRTIAWLGWTGGWGHPPRLITLDPALPPGRALDGLLDDIDAGTMEVSQEDRAAAARIASAYSSATYAPPLPAGAVANTALDAGRSLRDGGSEGPIPSASERSTEPAGSSAPPGSPADAGPGGVGSPRAGNEDQSAQAPLRADTDRLIALIRAAR